MIIARTSQELSAGLPSTKKIGFVPTMGALHEGHKSLLTLAKRESDFVVLSVFVNPTQFGPKEDFSKYPRPLEQDLELARAAGVDLVFVPSVDEIYPPGWKTFIEVVGITDILCGKFRPGHFRGVATVVHRLFQLVKPQLAFFGQKDLQQCSVIQKMVKDLGLSVEIRVAPTIREADGLAMSSRNRYLSSEDRKRALVISRALFAVNEAAKNNKGVATLEKIGLEILNEVPEFEVQYAEIRSMPDLELLNDLSGPSAYAIAGYLGGTRLIDNIVINP